MSDEAETRTLWDRVRTLVAARQWAIAFLNLAAPLLHVVSAFILVLWIPTRLQLSGMDHRPEAIWICVWPPLAVLFHVASLAMRTAVQRRPYLFIVIACVIDALVLPTVCVIVMLLAGLDGMY